MKSLIFVIALFFTSVCRAQYTPVGAISSWTDGYVITMNNDTIRGQIRIGTLVNDSPAGVVIRTGDNRKTTIKGENLRLIAQRIPDYAYSTGAIPRNRQFVEFERVPNPRRDGKPALLERLSTPGKITLYFDANGWKKNSEYTFGNFTIATNHKDFSFVVVKDGIDARIVKKGNLNEQIGALFGDCPLFIQQFPIAARQDWDRFGDMVRGYNQTCQVGSPMN